MAAVANPQPCRYPAAIKYKSQRMTMRRSLLLFSAAVIATMPQLAGAQATKPALYTADQATAGAAVYSQACAACHGPQLEGVAAPALKGSVFGEMATAQGLTVDSLFDVIANTMPQSDPGSLKPDE